MSYATSIWLALAQGQLPSVSTPLLVAIPISMVVSGVLLLVGFYFVHKRFIQVEFPGYVTRVEERLATLVHGTSRIEDSIVKLTVLLEKHEGRLDFHDWRLRQLERQGGASPDAKNGD